MASRTSSTPITRTDVATQTQGPTTTLITSIQGELLEAVSSYITTKVIPTTQTTATGRAAVEEANEGEAPDFTENIHQD